MLNVWKIWKTVKADGGGSDDSVVKIASILVLYKGVVFQHWLNNFCQYLCLFFKWNANYLSPRTSWYYSSWTMAFWTWYIWTFKSPSWPRVTWKKKINLFAILVFNRSTCPSQNLLSYFGVQSLPQNVFTSFDLIFMFVSSKCQSWYLLFIYYKIF